jgi:hypothetical protein
MSGVMEREIFGVALENARFDTKMKYSTKLRSIMELQVQLLLCNYVDIS